jgi:hypothetical protein
VVLTTHPLLAVESRRVELYRPQIPIVSALYPQQNLLNPLPPKKIPVYATADTVVKVNGIHKFIKMSILLIS